MSEYGIFLPVEELGAKHRAPDVPLFRPAGIIACGRGGGTAESQSVLVLRAFPMLAGGSGNE